MSDRVEALIQDLLNNITVCHSNKDRKTCITQGESNSEFYANKDYILQRVSEALSDEPIAIEAFDIGKIAINIRTKSRA